MKYSKVFIIIFLFLITTPIMAQTSLVTGDQFEIEKSATALLTKIKKNKYRDIFTYKNRLENQLLTEVNNYLKAEILFKLIIIDIEIDTSESMEAHLALLEELLPTLEGTDYPIIFDLFKAYFPVVDISDANLPNKSLQNIISSLDMSGSQKPFILGNILLALVEGYTGQYYLAFSNLGNAYSQTTSNPDQSIIDVLSAWTLGYLHTELSNPLLAIQEYSRAIDIAEEKGLPIDTSITIYNVGKTLQDFGYEKLTEDYFSYLIDFSQAVNDPTLINDSYYYMMVLYNNRQDYQKSHEYAEELLNAFPAGSWFDANVHQIEALNLVHLDEIEGAKKHLEYSNLYFTSNPEVLNPEWQAPGVKASAIIEARQNPIKAIDDVISAQEKLSRYLKQKSSSQFGMALQKINKNSSDQQVEKAIAQAQLDRQNLILNIFIGLGFIVCVGFLFVIKSKFDLKQSKIEAEQANIAKSRFLSQMSHELRTPLNSVIGFSETLQSNTFGDLTPKQKEFLGYIQDGGELLLKLINDLLDVSQIESEELKLKLQEHSPLEVFKTVLPLVQSLGEKNNIKIHISEENLDHTLLYIDKLRFEQILINLLANAFKFGKPNGNIWIDFETQDNQLQIFIKDDGMGIPEDQFSNVFKPFNRAGRENSGIEGTGAGLSISRALVNAMKGEINFVSKENEGSTFWLKFPLAS